MRCMDAHYAVLACCTAVSMPSQDMTERTDAVLSRSKVGKMPLEDMTACSSCRTSSSHCEHDKQNQLGIQWYWAYSRLTCIHMTRGAPKVMFRRADLPLSRAQYGTMVLTNGISEADFPQKAARLANFRLDAPVLRAFCRIFLYACITIMFVSLFSARCTVRNGHTIL